MKILVNRKIKRLFLYVLLAVAIFTVASILMICLGLKNTALYVAIAAVLMALIICVALYWYFRDQSKTMNEAIEQIREYIAGNRNARIECDDEGDLYRLFHEVNSLVTILNAHAENEGRAKTFMKDTISDISHQLKTPLAALNIYNGLMQQEVNDSPELKEFTSLSEQELDRIENLVQNLLKITKLDAGTITLEKECFRPDWRDGLHTLSMGISSSVNQIAITIVQVVLNNSLTYYGAMSIYGKEIPLAACGIVMKTNAILLAFIIGISQGSQPIIGFNYGARQYDRVRKTYKLAITANLCISAIGFVLFQFFPYQIISLFGTGDAAYFEFSVRFMRIFLFMVIFNGVQLISSNFFAAIGKPVKGLLLSMTRQVIFLIPLVLILPLFFGLDGILFAGPAADGIAFIVTICLIAGEIKKMKQMETEQRLLKQAAK